MLLLAMCVSVRAEDSSFFEGYYDVKELKKGELYGVKTTHDGLWGVYNIKTYKVTPYKYFNVFMCDGECYGTIVGDDGMSFDNYRLENGTETFVNHSLWYADVDAEDRYFSRGQLASPNNSTVPPFGIVDSLGRIIVPFEYNDIEELKNGEWYVVNKTKDGLYGVVGENNKQVADFKYYDVVEIDGNVYGMIENNGKVDYYKIDSDGESYYKTLDGYIFRGERGKVGYYTKRKGKEDYPLLSKKYGLVDSELNVIVKPRYDNQVIFKGDYADVYKGSTYASIEGGINRCTVYRGGELVYLKKDGDKIKEVENRDLPATNFPPEERAVIEPISTPEIRKQLAVLKAIEAVVILIAIGCVWWLVRHSHKKREKQD